MLPSDVLECIRSRSVDRSFLEQQLLDVTARIRTSALPWRGQFTPGLPEALISALNPSGTVLDPFVGSGTTLGEAIRADLPCIGAEVNPAALTLASSYELTNLNEHERHDLLNWTERSISQIDDPKEGGAGTGENPFHEEILKLRNLTDNAAAKSLLEIILTLSMGNGKSATRPRAKKALSLTRSLVLDLPSKPIDVRVIGADARKLPLPDSSIGMVLTSPPYINVFNYHQNYRPAMELLGWDVLPAARSEIGSNRKHRSNRFLTVIQYCLDMAQTLDEVMRVTEDGAPIVFVVGRESRVRGLAFPNGDILAGLAESTPGLSFERWQERSFTSRFGEVIFEEVLTFRRTGSNQRASIDQSFARNLGVALLLEAQKRGPIDSGEVRTQLNAAINSGDVVNPSPPLSLARATVHA